MTTKLMEWRRYTKFNDRIQNTPFVPFKMPVDNLKITKSGHAFQIDELLTQFDNIGLIIDLTKDLRTYQTEDLKRKYNVDYVNIPCDTKITSENWSTFVNTCAQFIAQQPPKPMIGVHCWTGTQQTGFLICKYLIEVCCQPLNVAINLFNEGREHNVDGVFSCD